MEISAPDLENKEIIVCEQSTQCHLQMYVKALSCKEEAIC